LCRKLSKLAEIGQSYAENNYDFLRQGVQGKVKKNVKFFLSKLRQIFAAFTVWHIDGQDNR